MSGTTASPPVVAVEELIERIKAGPGGPKIAAFFDFDGTLIQGYSANALITHRARNFELGPDEFVRTMRAALGGTLDENGFKDLMLQGIRGWVGRTDDELMELGEQLFTQEIAGSLFYGTWRLVRAHQNKGHTVVIATSATRMQVEPMARELGIDHVLCTELETENGVITGGIAGRPPWNEGKCAAVTEFARRKRIPLKNCHAYANGNEDGPFLDAVGFPHPVNPGSELARHAGERGWHVLRFRTKQNQFHPMALIRTTGVFGGFAAAVGAGTVLGVLTKDSRGGVDLATSLFGRLAGQLGNIKFDVIGEQHTAQRPAVFFINHQSTLIDALVTSRVVQRGFTVVAKAEVKQMPVLGQLLTLADVAFVDRSSTSKAVSALQPAVDRLRAGVSIAISPEGTRSLSPKIGVFKKGGFHLARDAGVPIVPIVIRNAGEIMWRNAKVAQQGTLEIAVHEPVPTADWTKADLDEWVPRMRQLYVDTLDDWPGAEAGEKVVGGDRGGAEMTVLPARFARLLRPNGSAASLLRPADRPEVAALLDSEEFISATAQLASQSGRDVADVQAEAALYVREMAASHVPLVVRAWHAMSAWMVRGFQVVIDDDDLAKLRALDRDNALIFLISHRSYLDQFSFPPRLTQGGIAPTFGLAGANLNFFPLGTLARRNGFIPVRRATGDMPAYRLALRALVAQMVASGRNLVWSIEGGRTRTGKLRPPRYGLLRYVTDAVESVHSERTVAVPVSILFDQLPLHEVKLMVEESRGLPKRPENARWLFSYARGLRHRLGRIYINFGPPVPLYERLSALRAEGLTDRQVVERVALDICHRLNQATPVTATAAVCVAMLGEDRALTLDEVCATVAPLARYLEARGWPVAGGADLTDRATVSQTLHDLVGSGVLTCYSEGPTTVWGIGDDQHLIVAVYRNSAIHVLVMRAIAELALLAIVQTPGATRRTGWEKALAVRELLKFDFFFAGRDEFADELWREFAIMTGRSHDRSAPLDNEEAEHSLNESDLLVAHLVLRPFVDAYRVVAEELVNLGRGRDVDEQDLLRRCLRLGRQWSLQHRITEESVSGEMFSTAVKMARHRGLLDAEQPAEEVARRRAALVAELDELQGSIGELARMRRDSARV